MLAAVAKGIETIPPIEFQRETLPNGLRVIYAPMRNAPVVHVQVLYHVGSKDEHPERQGFAHVFEHMMFRGSAHVASEQHMKLINGVGGNSNASTYVDWTRYVNTVPSNHTEMALWLEADRMASFRVNEEVFVTERNVVAEEWRLRTANPPYGTMWQDFSKTAYRDHHYRWTTIGDMDQLARSTTAELQQFFNTYYVPNNAVLVVAGDFDVAAARQWVQQYFAWIPKGPDVKRVSPGEPPISEKRKLVEYKTNIPLARVMMGFRTSDYRNDDKYALDLLGTILGSGRSSRLYTALVGSAEPMCVSASAGSQQFEDLGQFMVVMNLLPGKDPDAAEKVVLDLVAAVQQDGVSEDELAKAKLSARLDAINGRRTAQGVAGAIADAELFGGDANLVNAEVAKYDAVTLADIQRVAKEYLQPSRLSVVQYRPGQPPAADATRGTPAEQVAAAQAASAVVAANEQPMPEPRVTEFPDAYPRTPPMSREVLKATYNKGTEKTIGGVQVITIRDERLPLISWNLAIRGGSHAEPVGKEGVASLAAQMLTRGVSGLSQAELAADLESRGISINVSDGGDVTSISGTSTVDQFEHAMMRVRQVLREPTFPEDEFAKLKRQASSGLMQSLTSPATVAQRELTGQLFGTSPLGRQTTPQSLQSITLEDVKQWYQQVYRPEAAVLVFAGSIDEAAGAEAAGKLLEGWSAAAPPKAEYDLPAPASGRTIVLVDNPTAQQATIRVGIRSYDIRSDEKFAGSVATQVLSNGIDSRLNRYLRAEKGLTYGASGRFAPTRQAGSFSVSIDTRSETAGEAVQGIFKVLERMRSEPISDAELAEAQQRIAGSMVMDTQTVDQQAGRRVDGILNGYPIDYYEQLPAKVAAVTAADVQRVMTTHARDDRMTIVVVAPAEQVKSQLEAFGTVTVLPMPLKR
jgi:zinc protease